MRTTGWVARAATAACAAVVGASVSLGCGATAVEVMGKDEQPQPLAARVPRAHVHTAGSLDLPSDVAIIEPQQPAVGSAPERALAHVHGRRGVCSGVVIDPRVVVTAQKCVAAQGDRALYVEIATSTLTWTERSVVDVVLPACGWEKLDLAALVLDAPVDAFVEPLHVVAAPPPGAHVRALGFGHCAGETRGLSSRAGQVMLRDSDALVVDLPLCRGDAGGPLVDTATNELLALVSHRDGPNAHADRTTTTFTRLDTTPARALVAKAEALGRGAPAARAAAVACD